MNKLDLMKRRREVLNKVRIGNRKINVLRVSPNNTYEHEKTKFDVFFYCRQQGWDVISEAIFNNGQRADILILDKDIVIEVIHTELKKSCISKTKTYPVDTIILINAYEEFKGEDWF